MCFGTGPSIVLWGKLQFSFVYRLALQHCLNCKHRQMIVTGKWYIMKCSLLTWLCIMVVVAYDCFCYAGLIVHWSSVGFSCSTWYVDPLQDVSMLLSDRVTNPFVNCFDLMQLHIAFCIFAAIAPPVVFHGKSLT